MCGINGIAFSNSSGRMVNENLLEQMRDIIAHRGPDDKGIFIDGRVGLGHRRLSIVDVTRGHQPMTNEDGSLQITYNGEVYNHADYREELEAKGHRYRTHCDTETILHLYEEHGENCVSYLRGMFAFAIWDKSKQELFIARDRLGVKPLYYVHQDDGSLFFASEIKSLLRAGVIKPQLNYQALPDYLANHSTSSDETLFQDVKRLQPGYTMTWRDGKLTLRNYWDVSFAEEGSEGSRSDNDLIEEWSDLFRTSVKLRLMADVPLGMFLSGGIDSASIAAVMSEMVKDPIKTFSVAFREKEANELLYARLVAEKFKTDHHEILLSPADFFQALPEMVWHEDEPLAHPSSVALYFVSRLASEHVKVVLTGEGSDELLGGYERYYKTLYNIAIGKRYHQFMPGLFRRGIDARVRDLPIDSKVRHKLTRTFLSLAPDIETLYFDNFAVFTRSLQGDLLSPETVARIGTIDPYRDMRMYFDSSDSKSLLNRMLYTDTKTYLHELLMKQDQMSMAASLESRVPFLDHKLVEFTVKLPQRLKLRRGWTTKYVLRRAMKNVLPREILQRKKMGFPVPIGRWFREEFHWVIDDYVLGSRAMERRIFNPDFVRDLVQRHQAGQNHSERLWALVNFEMWQRRFIDGDNGTELNHPETEFATTSRN
jgi:asparagine synthase (glutamine-hydrolysing)